MNVDPNGEVACSVGGFLQEQTQLLCTVMLNAVLIYISRSPQPFDGNCQVLC